MFTGKDSGRLVSEGDSGKGYREGRFVRSLNAASGRISKSLNLLEISGVF